MHYPFFQNPRNVSTVCDALYNKKVSEFTREKDDWMLEDFFYLRRLYFHKLKEVDSNLSLLFDYIDKYESMHTDVILTADHGSTLFDDEYIESIVRNGGTWKASDFIESVLHVPLLIRKSGRLHNGGVVVDDFIENNLCLMPTVLDLAGLDKPDGIDGISCIGKGQYEMEIV